MVFFIIGLGLGDEKDISVKGLEAIKSCEKVYLESYTSILGVNKEKLELFYGKDIIEADRECCESGIDQILTTILQSDPKLNFAFLVVGDPFCATTHTDLFLRAVKLKIKVEVVHNASIINAIGVRFYFIKGCTGLMVYRFGEVVSIPFFTEKWRPYSFYEKIKNNLDHNLHTLILLDIKVKERNEENLMKDKKIYEAPRFMTTLIAVQQLLEAEENIKLGSFTRDSLCFGVARIGFKDQIVSKIKIFKIKSGKMSDFLTIDMGQPLHSLVLCASELHPIEQEMFQFYHNQQQLQQ